MTMPPPHPDDELLASFQDGDLAGAAAGGVRDHLSACQRCTAVIEELGTLRIALAELPDIAPPRPLRLIPPVGEAHARQPMGLVVRRLFAPLMAVGILLAVVGGVGVAGGLAVGSLESAAPARDTAADAFQTLGGEPGGPAGPTVGAAVPSSAGGATRESRPASPGADALGAGGRATGAGAGAGAPRAERVGAWPILIVLGVALLIGAAGLRATLGRRRPSSSRPDG
ncbi:MAG: hypothetical protein DLM71_08775 [Chloroflexi bacterium]|nr:MAG: hypothetical protein DLM71_08775 [Chloroflexota bacterium]